MGMACFASSAGWQSLKVDRNWFCLVAQCGPARIPFPKATMHQFQIPTMTCGHCVRAITEAVQAVDPAARVVADLPLHQVQIETQATRDVLVQQLAQAGYAPA